MDKTAWYLDGSGSAKQRPFTHEGRPQAPVWVNLNYSQEADRAWLGQQFAENEVLCQALLAEDTRPRVMPLGDGLLLALRGVNLNPDANPEDMISIRIWINEHQIISAHKRALLSVEDLNQQLQAGRGPCSSSDWLVMLIDQLISRMADTIEDFEDRAAVLEEKVLESSSRSLRSELNQLRRQSITLRRYLAPQRDALTRLCSEKISWIDENARTALREIHDRLTRYIEDLDAIRERALVTQEELQNQLSEEINQRTYVLSVVAAIFLPLGFLTGMFGINIGGMPGTESPNAFMTFTLILVILTALQVVIFRRKRWL